MKFCTLIAIALSLFCAGCERIAEDDETKVEIYSQFAAGDELPAVLGELDLNDKPVRFRNGMPPGEISAVYFVEHGNVHIEAKTVEGRQVLRTAPFFEAVNGTVEERVAAWDAAADEQNKTFKSHK